MSRDLSRLLQERTFLTSAGTETYLIFQQGFDLPEFCGFVVFEDPEAWSALEQNYLGPILQVAAERGHGLIVDALVWRAQPDFITQLGRAPDELAAINAQAVSRTRESVERWRQGKERTARELPFRLRR